MSCGAATTRSSAASATTRSLPRTTGSPVAVRQRRRRHDRCFSSPASGDRGRRQRLGRRQRPSSLCGTGRLVFGNGGNDTIAVSALTAHTVVGGFGNDCVVFGVGGSEAMTSSSATRATIRCDRRRSRPRTPCSAARATTRIVRQLGGRDTIQGNEGNDTIRGARRHRHHLGRHRQRRVRLQRRAATTATMPPAAGRSSSSPT